MQKHDSLKYSGYDIYIFILTALFIIGTSILMILKHNAFNTRVYDFARFSQAIWSVLDGRLLYTSISERSILGNHFSPIMALASPFLWLFQDERVLFVIQAINVGSTGLIIYWMVRSKNKAAAFCLALAFFLNPYVFQVTTFELRRVVFGMPWFALGIYGIIHEKWRLMLLGLFISLLAKESYAIYLVMLGFYLFWRREWRWGTCTMLLGGMWAILIPTFVIPFFNTKTGLYPQLYYYSQWGNSYLSIARNGISDPIFMLESMFASTQIKALLQVGLPFAPLLLLSFPLTLVVSPYVALMFLSNDGDMFSLDKWYTTSIMPVLFGAMATSLHRVPKWAERLTLGWLLVGTLIVYYMVGSAPFSRGFDATIYRSTPHDQVANDVIARIPSGASILSHPRYIPHLTDHAVLYHYHSDSDLRAFDYILMDRYAEFTPFDSLGISAEVNALISDRNLTIVEEGDGIVLLSYLSDLNPAYIVNKSAENKLHLDQFDIAIAQPDGLFRVQSGDRPVLQPGDHLRIALYWRSLSSDIAERTISLRLNSQDGLLLSQHDQLPVGGARATSWWQTDWTFRDTYYLTVPEDVSVDTVTLNLVIYDTYTSEIIRLENESDILNLLTFSIDR